MTSSRLLTLKIEGYGGAFFGSLRTENGHSWVVVAEDGSRAFETPTRVLQQAVATARTIPGGYTIGPIEWPGEKPPVNSTPGCLIVLLVCVVLAGVCSWLA